MMGKLIAVEGADGAGKRTITQALARLISSKGATVSQIAFPQYDKSIIGSLIGDILSHRTRLPKSPRSMAVLYALDRLENRTELIRNLAEFDFVISDRYVSSNIAYQAALDRTDDFDKVSNWISMLEFGMFEMPVPHLNVLLNTSLETSVELQKKKEQRVYTADALDRYEADINLQTQVRLSYARLASVDYAGPWLVLDTEVGGALTAPDILAYEIVRRLFGEMK
jgi:dTMP kinase